ncbi:hypothetical protein TCAL_15952 [Tigriopus californicus]|uniref:Uncharacterized protein n=1 Tax=Tigriopus californicus TaxID=6832 RepID=A0A553PHE3_TIGCA|nr:hypothetical protein TCAL_15952 [Tigriopus californicus]
MKSVFLTFLITVALNLVAAVKDEKTFVERGCLNKTDLGYVIFDDSITDECGSTSMFGSDWSFCVCQGDKCNGGGTVLATITLTVLAALTSKFAY